MAYVKGSPPKRPDLYVVWRGMLNRCTDAKRPDFKHYGGRGIGVCARWLSRENFVADIGPRPSPRHQLDRIDNDRGYEPGNVRWATRTEQLRNQRRNRLLTFAGETHCVSEWAELRGMSKGSLKARLKAGWPVERALTQPVGPNHRNG